MTRLTIALGQLNPLVGDIPGNTDKVIDYLRRARDELKADIVVFPELALIGYPAEDLLLRPSLQIRIERALERVIAACTGIVAVVGYPCLEGSELFNAAGVIRDGKLVARYYKNRLPNYKVFDEERYFTAGKDTCVIELCGVDTAISICEDVWSPEVMANATAQGARLMLNINASPFHKDKQRMRQQVLKQRSVEGDMPVVYVNQVGAQDELIFDGGSMVMDRYGDLAFRAPQFEESLYTVAVDIATNSGDTGVGVDANPRVSTHINTWVNVPAQQITPALDSLAAMYQALVLGVRDYVNKNGFRGVVLGLSGGIDSALTLAIAVDALGADRVEAVMMPFRYTSQLSQDDASDQAERMGVNYKSIGIEPIYKAFMEALADEFVGCAVDTTEENLQARSRGVLLMAISNKKGYLVLTTGNKSEMSVGYATLYGDMAGGLDVLKDVSKLAVFELSKYRNTLSAVIPESVITRPPSAELAPDQIDEDSLPPYEVLDQILQRYVEQDESAEEIVAAGFNSEEVYRILRMVDLSEYKRRQAPIGLRITERGFGRDRRYPITNGWKAGD
ncbi:MAG: NAD+ synthase [Porticoccaceae bacterium]|nr:NAD+ synthase [Porticoccaceae bacterium]